MTSQCACSTPREPRRSVPAHLLACVYAWGGGWLVRGADVRGNRPSWVGVTGRDTALGRAPRRYGIPDAGAARIIVSPAPCWFAVPYAPLSSAAADPRAAAQLRLAALAGTSRWVTSRRATAPCPWHAGTLTPRLRSCASWNVSLVHDIAASNALQVQIYCSKPSCSKPPCSKPSRMLRMMSRPHCQHPSRAS